MQNDFSTITFRSTGAAQQSVKRTCGDQGQHVSVEKKTG